MAKITKNLGACTAYGIALKHGYTGTESQWISDVNKYTGLPESKYPQLKDLPKLNDVIITGDKNSSDYGLANSEDLSNEIDRATKSENTLTDNIDTNTTDITALKSHDYTIEDIENYPNLKYYKYADGTAHIFGTINNLKVWVQTNYGSIYISNKSEHTGLPTLTNAVAQINIKSSGVLIPTNVEYSDDTLKYIIMSPLSVAELGYGVCVDIFGYWKETEKEVIE